MISAFSKGRDPARMARVGRGLVWLLIVTVLLLILISALGPEIEWDAVVVHLFAAKTYEQGHGLRPVLDVPQTFFPKHVTMLFTFGMLLHNETTAKLIHYLLGVLTLIAAYGFGCRVFSRDVALISAGILISSPLFVWEMRTAHTELGLTLYVFLSLMAALVWLRSKRAKLADRINLFSRFFTGNEVSRALRAGCLGLHRRGGTLVPKEEYEGCDLRWWASRGFWSPGPGSLGDRQCHSRRGTLFSLS